jgi:hypothetical protein
LHRLRTDRCQARAAKKRLDGHGAFRCGHFLRSILALAEIRGGTRGNFEHEAQGKTHSLPPPGDSDQSELLPKADIGSGGGHVGFVPIVLKKSFWGDERNFLEPLMRFTRGITVH